MSGTIYRNNVNYGVNISDSQPVGQIIDSASDRVPAGYLPCDGRSLLRSDYPDLFKKIGTKYGAEDDEHFNLPTEEDVAYLPLTGGAVSGDIQYQGSVGKSNAIQFLDNVNDSNGNGIIVEGGGLTMIGAGESATNFYKNNTLELKPGTEQLYLCSDNDINFVSKMQSGVSGAKTFKFAKEGYVDTPNGILGGCFESKYHTVADMLNNELCKTDCGGGIRGGSIRTTTATLGVPTGWYNFIYIPHRTGLSSGGDNHLYGTLLLFPMTSNASNYYMIHRINGTNYNANAK